MNILFNFISEITLLSNICHLRLVKYFILHFSCLLFILVATESSVIDSSVKTPGYNDTVDSEILAKDPETVEKYIEQQRQNVPLSENEKDQREEVVGDTHQVRIPGISYLFLLLNLRFIYCQGV